MTSFNSYVLVAFMQIKAYSFPDWIEEVKYFYRSWWYPLRLLHDTEFGASEEQETATIA